MNQSNDSGLNLDHLEALARAAAQHGDNIGEEEWYSADENMSIFVGNPDLDLVAACSPVAVLELIALARRAAPVSAPIAGDAMRDALQGYVKFAATRRVELGALSQEMEDVDAIARAALANQPAPTVPADLQRYNISSHGLPFFDPAGSWVAYADLSAHQPAQEPNHD